jgi:hypothetical protein
MKMSSKDSGLTYTLLEHRPAGRRSVDCPEFNRIYIYIYIYIYSIEFRIYIYIYIYTHTHTHT